MYVRLTTGLKDKGQLIPVEQDIYKYIDPLKDNYASVFFYNEEQNKKFQETGTIAGIQDVVTNKLYFDFDSPVDVEQARKDTIKMVETLEKSGISDNYIDIFYSGKKGFHVIVETEESFTPKQMRTIATKLGKSLPTLDTSVYNASRILRLPSTRHNETGLYKTYFTKEELKKFTLDEIRNHSSVPTTAPNPVKIPISKELKELCKEEKIEDKITLVDLGDATKNPLKLSPWKNALFNGYFPPSNRSNAYMILAATLKAKGIDQDTCFAMLSVVNKKQSTRHEQSLFDERELEANIIGQVYGGNWQGKTYSEDSFPLALQEYLIGKGFSRQGEERAKVFESTNDVFSTFDKFAKNIDANTIKTGIAPLDEAVVLTTSMLVGILGAPSSFKTGFSMNVLEIISKSKEKAAFFSLDMGSPLVYQRMIQKVTGYGSKKIKEIFKNNNEVEIKKIQYLVNQSYSNIDFCFKTALSVEEIRENIIQRQESSGNKYRLIVIDYLECIQSDTSDLTARMAMISQKLKDIANELDVCILLLLQPTKVSGTPRDPLDSYAKIRGSGNISAACSVIISLWREGFSPKTADQDKFITFAVLKNRMGTLNQLDFGFDGLTGLIYDLDEQERQELEQLRALNRSEKNDNGGF